MIPNQQKTLFIAHCVTCKTGVSEEMAVLADQAATNHAMKRLVWKREQHRIEIYTMVMEKTQEVVTHGDLHR